MEASKEEAQKFLQSIDQMSAESATAAEAGKAALERLASVAATGGGSQVGVVRAWLASAYNGGDALPVRLDDIRRLDWTLQRDLAALLLGVGKTGFDDAEIRKALHRAGGEPAVEDLHWFTTGGAHREALHSLVEFVRDHRKSPTATAIVNLFTSVASGPKVDLSRIGALDREHATAFLLVLSALYGADRSLITIEDLKAAFLAAEVTL